RALTACRLGFPSSPPVVRVPEGVTPNRGYGRAKGGMCAERPAVCESSLARESQYATWAPHVGAYPSSRVRYPSRWRLVFRLQGGHGRPFRVPRRRARLFGRLGVDKLSDARNAGSEQQRRTVESGLGLGGR